MRRHLKRVVASLLVSCLAIQTLICNPEVVLAAPSPKLSSTKIQLYVGQSKTLKVKNTTVKKVTWKSKNSKVATVTSKGKITAKREGNTTITAKVNTKTLSCKVTVKKISLNKSKVTLDAGKTTTLKLNGATVKNWTSSNKSVATVNKSGKVTAKKPGTATIKATAKNKKIYSCKVVVRGKVTPTVKITATPKPVATITPKPSLTVEPTVTPTEKPKQLIITIPYGYTIEQYLAEHSEMASYYEMFKDKLVVITSAPTPTVKATVTPTPTSTTHAHNYTSRVIYSPTCETPGLRYYTCDCGASYSEDIESLGHKWSGEKTEPSTCITKGYTYIECERCKLQLKLQELDLIEHDYQEKVISEATCRSSGAKIQECTMCGDQYGYTYIPPLPHKYSKEVIEPTCTSEGYTLNTCRVCGLSYRSDQTDKIDHSYKATTVKPGQNTTGYTLHTCESCGDSYKSDPIPATALEWLDYDLDNTNKTITINNLNYYTSNIPEDIVIYPYYEIGYEKYSTIINFILGSEYSYNGSNSTYSKFKSIVIKGGTIKKFKVQDCSGMEKIVIEEGTNTTLLTSAYNMFYLLPSLTTLDLSGLDTSNITDMQGMFNGCTVLKELDLSKFNTVKVINMQNMFINTSVENLDISSFYITKLKNIRSMFYNCKSNQIKISNTFKNAVKAQLVNNYTYDDADYIDVSEFDTNCSFDIRGLILN